ncbi:MAG: autotransporter domain-containing protein [Flavobacteriaceae bacterium]
MKKIILILSLVFLGGKSVAQNTEFPKNEIKFNIANTIILASAEVGYERFIDRNQSLEVVALINDRINYHSESGSRNFKTNSFKVGYNYYFDNYNAGAGLYANPFIKYRFGDFEQDVILDGFPDPVTKKTDMDTFMVGIGAGYKWNFNDTFVLAPFASVARNFSDEVGDRFSNVEFHAGLYVGYRF